MNSAWPKLNLPFIFKFQPVLKKLICLPLEKNGPLIVKYAWLQQNLPSQARKIYQAKVKFYQIKEEEKMHGNSKTRPYTVKSTWPK